MFTVILLSDAAKSIFEPARVYFEPFIESGQIALCDWDQSHKARNLREAVPGLPDLIKGKPAWRAVVIDHPRNYIPAASGGARDPENPFDFVSNTDPSLSLEESPYALIRIAHMLLGYPQISAQYFEPYLQYEDGETGEAVSGHPRQLLVDFMEANNVSLDLHGMPESPDDSEWFALAATTIGQSHHHVRRLFREVPYGIEAQQIHADLVQRYDMREIRPSEVVFLSTRAPVTQDERAELRRAWRTDGSHVPTRFVERNDYPPMSRFAVFDLVEPENSAYEQDQLKFWLSALATAINQLPPGGFQADRLYRIDVELAKEGLGEMLNEHLSRLGSVRERLDRIMRSPSLDPEHKPKDLLRGVETPVIFEDLGGDELKVSTTGYGLAGDKPREEHSRWVSDVRTVSATAALFMRKPKRAVARGVGNARQLARMAPDGENPLSDIAREEMQDELAKRLGDLVVPTTADILDQRRMSDVIREGDLQVRKFIEQRMRTVTIRAALSITVGVWLIVFVPYLLQAWNHGSSSIAQVTGILILVLALVGITAVGVLASMKMRLQARVRAFNDGLTAEVYAVKSGADAFAGFLAEFVTYRRGAERLRSSERQRASQAAHRRRLRVLRERVGEKILEEKEIVRGIGVPVQMHLVADSAYYFDPTADDIEMQLFGFPPGETVMPFNRSGEFIDAPYDFMTKLTLERLPVYETAVEHDGGELA
ncbi:hypothetical protein [Leucobacter salsicius]|uniref:hypothetical protein n=1 Tax=Leucobacter salsicius TaxID=664638 RepID=UPI00034C47E6|nr:hypothetical protein [Leucobacter salsicius]